MVFGMCLFMLNLGHSLAADVITVIGAGRGRRLHDPDRCEHVRGPGRRRWTCAVAELKEEVWTDEETVGDAVRSPSADSLVPTA